MAPASTDSGFRMVYFSSLLGRLASVLQHVRYFRRMYALTEILAQDASLPHRLLSTITIRSMHVKVARPAIAAFLKSGCADIAFDDGLCSTLPPKPYSVTCFLLQMPRFYNCALAVSTLHSCGLRGATTAELIAIGLRLPPCELRRPILGLALPQRLSNGRRVAVLHLLSGTPLLSPVWLETVVPATYRVAVVLAELG